MTTLSKLWLRGELGPGCSVGISAEAGQLVYCVGTPQGGVERFLEPMPAQQWAEEEL